MTELTAVSKAVDTLISSSARKATVFLGEDRIVRATRQFRPDARRKSNSYILTIGKPAFVDRRFIRLCKQAGKPLPVGEVLLKYWPEKRK